MYRKINLTCLKSITYTFSASHNYIESSIITLSKKYKNIKKH